MAQSIISCDPNEKDISLSISKATSDEFKSILKATVNPYGTGGASKKILAILKETKFDNILKKEFYDIEMSKI